MTTQQLVTKIEADPPAPSLQPTSASAADASGNNPASPDPSVQTDVLVSTGQSTGFGLTTEAPAERSAERRVLTKTSTYMYRISSQCVLVRTGGMY
jgi:hypothetical protein